MLNTFASVGTRSFDVTTTDIDGKKVEGKYRANLSFDELRRRIGRLLPDAERDRHNVIIRPRSATVTLIQLDDLEAEKVQDLAPHAFLVISTSPGNHQVWIAVKDAPEDFARRLRKGAGADATASGATRIAGSLNFKSKYAPAFPLVQIIYRNAGHVTTAVAVEEAGFLAAPEQRRPPRPAANVGRHSRKTWPDYQRCVQGAPSIHRGGRPDISRADFTWCRTAIEWGWSVKETASRLMELSSKAREDGQRYALRTATRAAGLH